MSVKLNVWKLEKFYATEEETLEKRPDRGREGEKEREREREMLTIPLLHKNVFTPKQTEDKKKFYILH